MWVCVEVMCCVDVVVDCVVGGRIWVVVLEVELVGSVIELQLVRGCCFCLFVCYVDWYDVLVFYRCECAVCGVECLCIDDD